MIYPDAREDMRERGHGDKALEAILDIVNLNQIVTREGGGYEGRGAGMGWLSEVGTKGEGAGWDGCLGIMTREVISVSIHVGGFI